MTQSFIAFLLTSGIGTVLALLLCLFRPLTEKIFSARWHYYMWLVVLLVMMLPLRLTPPQTPVTTRPTSESLIITERRQAETAEARPTLKTKAEQPKPITRPQRLSNIRIAKSFFSANSSLLAYSWLTVTLLLFLIKLLRYWFWLLQIQKHTRSITCPEIKAYTNRKIQTRVSDSIRSPLMIGFVKPTLLLPNAEITPEQLQNVLAHETTHLKRNDILYKWFVSIVKCVHWFNPIIYYVSHQIDIDCEISCDLAVIKEMNEEQKKGYAETILSLLTHNKTKTVPLTTGMGGNRKNLKRRFIMIKNKININKKTAVLSALVAIFVLASAICISAAANGRLYQSYQNTTLTLNTAKVTDDSINLLLVGLDHGNRADTIMLLSIKKNGIQGLSIPRNAVWNDDKKISDIFAAEDGDQALIDTLQKKLAVPIHYYAEIDLSVVQKMVDRVGGIEFNVPMDMNYEDPYQNLQIHLKKGLQTLHGDEICQLLQFRRDYTEGDMSRIELHQQFIKEAIRQKLTKENLDLAPKLFKDLTENIKTNYPLNNLKQDMNILRAINRHNVSFKTIEGQLILRNEMPVYKIDETKPALIG